MLRSTSRSRLRIDSRSVACRKKLNLVRVLSFSRGSGTNVCDEASRVRRKTFVAERWPTFVRRCLGSTSFSTSTNPCFVVSRIKVRRNSSPSIRFARNGTANFYFDQKNSYFAVTEHSSRRWEWRRSTARQSMLNLRNTSCERRELLLSRRQWLQRAGAGMGALAAADLLARDGLLAREQRHESANAGPLTPRPPHFAPRATSVIWLFMEGAPSAVDTFDPKPELTKRDGEKFQIDVFNGNPGPLMKSPFQFQQHGESGAWVCDKYPHVARHVDEFAFIKSLYSESNDHVPALYQINTGISRPGFPAAGAWITYGLGSENQNLPGFVVLGNNQGIKGGPLNWHAGFLPSSHQGTLFRSEGTPILNLSRPGDVTREDQRRQLDLLARLNANHSSATVQATRSSWGEFSRSNSLSGCKPRRRNLSTYRRKQRQRESSTESSDPRRSRTVPNACWLAD
jgi:hypothetical protein